MIQVDQRQLGASGLTVPALGVGIWSWGDTRYWQYGQNYTREDVIASLSSLPRCWFKFL